MSAVDQPQDAGRRRAAVVARYGSAEAAQAPCEREAMIRAGVEPWRKVLSFNDRTLALDGWFGTGSLYGMAPRHVVAASLPVHP